MFNDFFRNKFYSNFMMNSNDEKMINYKIENDKFEKLLYQNNPLLHKEVIRAYSNYMISYTPRAFKSNTYEKLKSTPEYFKDFDANNPIPYSLKDYGLKYHKKSILENTSEEFKNDIVNLKSTDLISKDINNNNLFNNDSSDLNEVNKIDYVKYKKLLVESKRSHFFNCVVQFLFLNNYPIFISK